MVSKWYGGYACVESWGGRTAAAWQARAAADWHQLDAFKPRPVLLCQTAAMRVQIHKANEWEGDCWKRLELWERKAVRGL